MDSPVTKRPLGVATLPRSSGSFERFVQNDQPRPQRFADPFGGVPIPHQPLPQVNNHPMRYNHGPTVRESGIVRGGYPEFCSDHTGMPSSLFASNLISQQFVPPIPPPIAPRAMHPVELHESRPRKRKTQEMLNKPPPLAPKTEQTNQKPAAAAVGKPKVENGSDDGNCIICLCEPDPDDLATINGCDHQFCFGCIEKWAERENTCPLCKNRFTEIQRVNSGGETGDEEKKASKKVKQRDQRADLHPANVLEGLLANIGASTFLPPYIERMLRSNQNSTGFLESHSGATRSMPRRSSSVRFRNPQASSSLSLPPDLSVDGSDDEDSNRSIASDEADFRAFVYRMRASQQARGAGTGAGGLISLPQLQRPRLQPISRMAPPRPRPNPTAASINPYRQLLTLSPPQYHAINGHDFRAGGTADNALEINDESDDEVEVVAVRREQGFQDGYRTC